LAILFQHPVQTIRQSAADLLVKMHQADSIQFWGPNEIIMPCFWKISSPVIFNLSRQMMETKSNDDGIKSLLELVIRLFKTRYSFLKTHQVC
jgi:neurofibromin 1